MTCRCRAGCRATAPRRRPGESAPAHPSRRGAHRPPGRLPRAPSAVWPRRASGPARARAAVRRGHARAAAERKAPSPQAGSTTVSGPGPAWRRASASTASTRGGGVKYSPWILRASAEGAGTAASYARTDVSAVGRDPGRTLHRAPRPCRPATARAIACIAAAAVSPLIREELMAGHRLRRVRHPGRTRWAWTPRCASTWASWPSGSRPPGASVRSTGPSAVP